MLAALRRALLAMTRVLPAAGFGGSPEPPTDEIRRAEVQEAVPTPPELREQRHVNVTTEQQRGGKHPDR